MPFRNNVSTIIRNPFVCTKVRMRKREGEKERKRKIDGNAKRELHFYRCVGHALNAFTFCFFKVKGKRAIATTALWSGCCVSLKQAAEKIMYL